MIAFSMLAVAGYASAQTSTTTPAAPSTPSTTTPSTPTAPSTDTSATPKRDTGTATAPKRSEDARPGGVAQNNPGPNPKEGPSPNQKEGTAGGTATAQGTASTRGARAGGKVTFQSLDSDSDGMISKTEAQAAPEVSKMFARLDKNKDGKLDNAEFSSHKWK